MNCISQPSFRIRRLSAKSKMGQIQVVLLILFNSWFKAIMSVFVSKLILGPMFSGKSTELIRRLKRFEIANYKCLIIKYAKDTRYAQESIATHDDQTLKALSVDKLKDIKVNFDDYDVIGIDEGQFFPDIVEFSEEMANRSKTVMVAALDGTFQRKAFASILELVPLAESVIKLTAVCMNCFGEGSYTKRISADKEVEVIGGADKYMAVCRSCYFSPVVIPASPRLSRKGALEDKENELENDNAKRALFETKIEAAN